MSVGGLIWPDYVAVEADGYAVADDSNVARTPFDDGFIRQERRFASALTALRLRVLIADDDDYSRFRAWAADVRAPLVHLDRAGKRHPASSPRARRRRRDRIHRAHRWQRPALVGGDPHA